MSWFGYAAGPVGLSWKVFWRNRRSTFIGFLLPVLLNPVIAAPLRNKEIGGAHGAGYVAVGLLGLALVTSFVNLLGSVAARREELVLKRLRGTECPPSAVFAGQLGAGAAVVLIQALVLGSVAVGRFGAPLPADPGCCCSPCWAATCCSRSWRWPCPG
ncbi:ABC transporter permease [Kitasatospora sp. NPDC059646]|uniref:ABC transporter permease n=1 Tax=Kitasatospora sp. NPDC059646 TaxID=3346893 RepID=UPI0036CCF4D2